MFAIFIKSKLKHLKYLIINNNDSGKDTCMALLEFLLDHNDNVFQGYDSQKLTIDIAMGEAYDIDDDSNEIMKSDDFDYFITNLTGTLNIKSLDLGGQFNFGDNTENLILNFISQSAIEEIHINEDGRSQDFLKKIDDLLEIEIQNRAIPILTVGNCKSASKIMKM